MARLGFNGNNDVLRFCHGGILDSLEIARKVRTPVKSQEVPNKASQYGAARPRRAGPRSHGAYESERIKQCLIDESAECNVRRLKRSVRSPGRIAASPFIGKINQSDGHKPGIRAFDICLEGSNTPEVKNEIFDSDNCSNRSCERSSFRSACGYGSS
jgi:hypothetical protein